jgi:hypothetical protein
MKRNVRSLFPAKALTNLILAAVVLFLSALNSSAQQPYHQVKFKNGSITYRGSADQSLIFNLSVENAADSKIGVIILDENGERILKRTFQGKKIEKLFKVPEDTYTLTFIISNPAEKFEQQFKINTRRRYVEDVTITKVL